MYLLIVYGIVNIVIYEEIMKLLREKLRRFKFIHKLITCPTCFSFWVGSLLYFLFNFSITGYEIDFILSGFLSSGVVNLLEHIKIRLFYEE